MGSKIASTRIMPIDIDEQRDGDLWRNRHAEGDPGDQPAEFADDLHPNRFTPAGDDESPER